MQITSDPVWSSNVQEEVKTFISTHTSSPSLSGDALIQALSEIPLTAWESQTPNLDLCIRETLRTSQPYTAVRKNIGPDVTIGPYVIPSGSLVVYPFSDTALTQITTRTQLAGIRLEELIRKRRLSAGAGESMLAKASDLLR